MLCFGLKNFFKHYFEKGSTMTFGERGTGKDLLCGNYAYKCGYHISNIEYKEGYQIPLDFDLLDVKNSCVDFVEGAINKFEYKYPEGVDIFISDINVYFPSTEFALLNKKFSRLPYFLSLSRQIANADVHLNCQSLARVWDKFREQSRTYGFCVKCKYFKKFDLVIQKVILYDKYDSALLAASPFMLKKPSVFASKDVKQNYLIERQRHLQQFGNIKKFTLIYKNKSNYDTRYFKKLLKEGNVFEEKKLV